MAGTVLTEEVGDGVRVVTLNRPQRLNAITPELLEDLIAALQAADREPAIRAVVLTGAGRAFCAGDDLKEFASQSTDEATTRAYIERIQDVTRAMLFERVWGYRFDPRTNLVDVHVGRLRRKVDSPGDPPLLHTVRGVGFALHAART